MSAYPNDRAGSPGGIVLIASAELLAAWSERSAPMHDVLAVSQDDLAAALGIIRRRQPSVVVLEEGFAVSPRASALVARLQTDPEFRHVEVRLLTTDGAALTAAHGHAPINLAARARPLPVRHAARLRPGSHAEVLVGGAPAQLVNISTSGVQVCSRVVLRPEQHISVLFSLDTGPIRIPGVVVWSAFELRPAPSYRVGIRLAAAIPLAAEEILSRLQPVSESR